MTATIERGDSQFLSSPRVLADATGQASFALQVGTDTTDLIVRVTALAQTVRFLAIVGAVDVPGIPEDIVVSGSVAYIADGTRTQIVDISNPEAPRRRSEIRVSGEDHRLALDDPWLYLLTSGIRRLYMVDTNRLPMLTERQPTPRLDCPEDIDCLALEGDEDDRAIGLLVQADLAYIIAANETTGDGLLQVVNVREPSAARLLLSSRIPGQPADIAISDGIVYVPAGKAGLLLFDLRNPAQLVPLPILEGNFASGITIERGLAYVVEERAGENRFTVLDLHQPAAPQRRGSVLVPAVRQMRNRFPIDIVEPYVYLLEAGSGLRVLDISHPDSPLSVGRINTPSEALSLAVTTDLIYVTDFIFGLQVIQGPGTDPTDTDGDGVVDFFDSFPFNPAETQDSDGDGLGDQIDDDDDNDSFLDVEEEEHRTDPTDPRLFPVNPPPEDATTVFVHAART